MSLLPAVVVLVVVVGLIVAAAVALTAPWRVEESAFVDSEGSGEIESPLLRRPLRSRVD